MICFDLKYNRPARFVWCGLSLLAACVMAAAGADTPDPMALLRGASDYMAARGTTQVDMTMTMDYKDGARETSASVMGNFILGSDSDARIQLKTGNEEVVVYNNSAKKHVFFPTKNTFQEMPPEARRGQLLRSALSGPLESSFVWLADFLHGADFAFEEGPSYAVGEIDGVPHHVLEMTSSQYALRAFLLDTTPPLLHQFDLELRGAALRSYARTPEGFLRVSAVFTNWVLDEELPEGTFTFSPPPGASLDTGPPARPQDKLIGQTAPEFSLPLLEGGTMKLSDHKDKDIVILDFWASWCGPCRQAMPIVVSVAERFKDKNVVLYAINLRENAEKARSFLQQQKLSVVVPMDSGEVAAKYGVTGIPRLVLIGKDGLIKSIHSGMSPALERQLTEEIAALLP